METLKYSKPKARKEHQCNFCCNKINKGEVYDSQTNVYENEIYVWKSHTKCGEIASKLKMYENSSDGVTDSDFFDYINEAYSEIDEKFKGSEKTNFEDRLNIVCDFHLKAVEEKIKEKDL